MVEDCWRFLGVKIDLDPPGYEEGLPLLDREDVREIVAELLSERGAKA